MAVIVKGRRGQDVILLNPYEKGSKFFDELRNNVHITNDGFIKTKKNGKPTRLTETEKAWRSGYLAAQKDSRRAFKSKQRKYGR